MVKKPTKSPIKTPSKNAKSSKSKALNVYSNLTNRRKVKKDVASRKRAEYLATLPKHPVKRLLYRLHPQRFWGYWFSKRGLLMLVKITGVFLLVMMLTVGALFAYFRKDLDQIKPDELAKRVQSSVTKYYDRNGILLWQDEGRGNYKLVVESNELSDNLKKATVAIEDRDFYKHSGVSVTGTVRAVVNNALGGGVQGGSTLTQQLVKQVFFSDESGDRGLGGIPRKIKEAILAIEVERIYNKDQILTLYLNESPYGGPRNGAESGAQAYFGKSAKDLSLAEASLLAAIPQNPTAFDPFTVAGHERLIARQHLVLSAMTENGYITKAQADEAKAYPILDHLVPQTDQYDDIKAPHFVEMVRTQLEEELGTVTVGQGGLSVTTTLDYRIQQKLEEAMATMFNGNTDEVSGFTNGASTVEDTQTGQIVAMMGSRDFNYDGYGQDNASLAYIQPGSTIKPLVYAQLFQQKPTGQANYGSGSILPDEPIDDIYKAPLFNADRRFNGNITIRQSLATSRNIPAVKAMAISGVQPTLEEIRALGGSSYCTQGSDAQAQLSSAIGGCGIKQVDLVNAYSSVARGGVYKEQSSVLEVKNNSGEVLIKWADSAGKQIIDPQAAYIVTDILHDNEARRPLGAAGAKGMLIPGVDTASKTGTSDKDGQAKDIWMMSYSPALTMSVWLGNPDTTPLKRGSSLIPGPIVDTVMAYAHKDVYASEGKWKPGDWYTAPRGIQKIDGQIYPSYYNKTQGQSNASVEFDRSSKKRATKCTPAAARVSLNVIKSTDPVTKKDVYTNVPDGYDGSKEDDVHHCNDDGTSTDPQPSIQTPTFNPTTRVVTVIATPGGSNTVMQVSFTVQGVEYVATNAGTNTYTVTLPGTAVPSSSDLAKVQDSLYYTASASFQN